MSLDQVSLKSFGRKNKHIVFTFNLKEFALSLQKHFLIHLSFLMYYYPDLLPSC